MTLTSNALSRAEDLGFGQSFPVDKNGKTLLIGILWTKLLRGWTGKNLFYPSQLVWVFGEPLEFPFTKEWLQ